MKTIRTGSGESFGLLLTGTFALCILIFAIKTIHWPILGDTSLMHYTVLLMDRGAVPYRDIAEMNLPGSYFVEWVVVHTLGGGDFAWRMFDFFLMMSAIAAMVVIALPIDWFAGFWAGSLLLLLHGRDGIIDLGQRDLTAAVCLLVGYAFLFVAMRRGKPSLVFAFGVLSGLAALIKPTFVPLGLVSLGLVYLHGRRAGKRSLEFPTSGMMGFALPWLGALLFLLRDNATSAFLGMATDMIVYHAGLARRSIGYLMLHSVSPILPLVLL